MENALVVGASGGIGTAVCEALVARGCAVTPLSRAVDGLDITSEASIQTHFAALTGPFDFVFVATGALAAEGLEPEKAIREVSEEGMVQQFRVNALGPMLVLKHSLRFLPRDRRAVFAVLSARVGSIGDNAIGGWHSYRGSKAALNQFVHGASIELGRTHRQAIAVCLHPGTVETSFTEKYAKRHKTVPAQDAAVNLLSVIDGLTPKESGGFFDYAGKAIPW